MLAYFPDDNAFDPEGDAFWVKGKSRADVILRAPVVDIGEGRFVTKAIVKLTVESRKRRRSGDRVTDLDRGRDRGRCR